MPVEQHPVLQGKYLRTYMPQTLCEIMVLPHFQFICCFYFFFSFVVNQGWWLVAEVIFVFC